MAYLHNGGYSSTSPRPKEQCPVPVNAQKRARKMRRLSAHAWSKQNFYPLTKTMSKRKPVSQEFVDDSDDPEDTGVNVAAKYTRS